MSNYVERDLDNNIHWLVAMPACGTIHDYKFFNPDALYAKWSEYKYDAKPYDLIESAEAQIALLDLGDLDEK